MGKRKYEIIDVVNGFVPPFPHAEHIKSSSIQHFCKTMERRCEESIAEKEDIATEEDIAAEEVIGVEEGIRFEKHIRVKEVIAI